MKSRLRELVLEREIEAKKRIPQTEIAEETGLDNNTISRWMSDKPFRSINVDTAGRLCQWLKCGLGDLLVFTQPDNQDNAA